MSFLAIEDVSAALARFSTSGKPSQESRPAVTVVESHISWVFLTDQYAYKLKKPVRFEFLDFSTPEKRHQACLDELRLNRRLAPDVYLGVLPIQRTASGVLAVHGDGVPLDWVVQMQRLPDARSLSALIRYHQLTRQESQSIIEYLASFYAGLPSVNVSPSDYLEALERHIRANIEMLLTVSPAHLPQARRAISAQLRYRYVQADLLAARVVEGRIVDGHGDLRPEHVYLNRHPSVIDCVEFSNELRHVDVADDLSFLAMECEHLGAADLGDRIMATCEAICGDVVPRHLTAFYRSYRACVRAKIALLRARQRGSDSRDDALFEQYLHLADVHAAELGPPLLLLVGGLMGSGKTTLATELARCLGVACLSTDNFRRDQFGPSDVPASYGEANYQPEIRRRIYDDVLRQAEQRLRHAEAVVLDGTFLTAALRGEASAIARRHGAVPVFVMCTCPRSVAITRIEQRNATQSDASEARPELFDLQSREFEAPSATELYIEVNTVCSVRTQASVVFRAIRPVIFGELG